MQKEISVIIPFYNRFRYLPEALESVFYQTSGSIELILVDDGSTDASLKVACRHWESLCKQFLRSEGAERRLVSLSIPHSGMPGLLRNRGVELASAPLIAFLDSDDLWLPQKLERQFVLHGLSRISHTRERWLRAVQGVASKGRKTVGADTIHFREVSQKTQQHRREGNIFQDALWKCIIGPSTVIMERDLFDDCGGFREDLEVAEDYEFWLRVTSGEEVAYVDEPLVEKRAGMPHQNQLSERYGYIEMFRVRALRELLDRPEILNSQQKEQAWRILRKKAEIVQKGAEKRGRAMEEMAVIIRNCEEAINAKIKDSQ